VAALFPRESRALEADELVLIVNKNVPEGRKLAERYAGARHVPDGRILEMGLPVGDDISFEQYEREVVPGVRRFLTENGLREKVKCLVTFYGVPLRVARRPAPTEAERRELAMLQSEVTKTRARVESIVADFEKLAKGFDATFDVRLGGSGADDVARRAERAAKAIERALGSLPAGAGREEATKQLVKVMEQLTGPNTATLYLAQRAAADPNLPAGERERWEKMVAFVQRSKEQVRDLGSARYDAGSRARVRELVRDGFGLMEYAGIVQGHLEYLRPGTDKFDTTAAFDNELALLWWDLYPRMGWQMNPLHHAAARAGQPPVVMTARLDAPSVVVADRMLADSIRTEGAGLDGRVVVDSRGIAGGRDAYAAFDRQLVALAELVKGKSKLTVFEDVNDAVMPPGSAENVALYAGWYSVQKYVPGSKFVPGAVGYHIASFEMSSLHSVGGFWVPHLLQDGLAASLGPVAEPYLTAFPMPQEFFPVLMTGKLTLAETYWRTTPMTSWMMGLVGDPLYNPFKKAPAMRVEDLPAGLQGAVRMPASPAAPATRP
jgi:uncharacterized protein (TIGR03790 family)